VRENKTTEREWIKMRWVDGKENIEDKTRVRPQTD
jgi:hypothetical protein